MTKNTSPQRFFAASNSARGFQNYFDEIFSPRFVDHLYIIKGGPGTGKSYFMKAVACRAAAAGYAVTEYACSSDPDSLDGLILRRHGGPTIGFVDGTAPHTAEAVRPGVREELIDLGVFWDASVLLRDRDTITRRSAEKAAAYANAYAHLRAAGDMDAVAHRLLDTALRPDRLAALTARILRGLPPNSEKNGKSGKITANATVAKPRKTGRQPWLENDQSDVKTDESGTYHRRVADRWGESAPAPSIGLRRAFGMTGQVTLPTYERMADTVVLLGEGTPADRLLAVWVLMAVYEQIGQKGGDVLVSPDPLISDRLDGLLYTVPDSRTAVLVGGTGEATDEAGGIIGDVEGRIDDAEGTMDGARERIRGRTISLRRCLDPVALRAIRPELRRVDALRERHEDEALACLRKAAEAHFALESIYTAAMDIPAKEVFCEQFCGRLFGYYSPRV